MATRFLSREACCHGETLELRKGLTMMQKILRVIAVSAVFWVRSVSADPGCQNAEVIGGKLITDICWSCIFPIKVAGVPISGGGGSFPSEAVSNPLCMCEDNLGVPRPGVTESPRII
ncbi:TraU family protein [Enterobacter hormaechei]|uniref:TraU family protein n=1 Tax=Enterobacter hormaechei TaxID=158836 RepID=UPI003966FFC8